MEYKNRDKILEELGYDDYIDYLKGDLWTEIRDQILKESKYTCVCCDNEYLDETLVMQVHHMVYTKENLSGESIYGLVAICRTCHIEAEFKPNSKKKNLEEANGYVLGKRPKTKKKKTSSQFYRIKQKCKICKLESDNRKEICTYCENQQESLSPKCLGNNDG